MRRAFFATVLLLASAASAWAQDRSATIDNVWIEYDQKHQYEWGISFKTDFQINGCYGDTCTIVIYIYDANKQPLKDRNGEYFTSDGNVATMEDFVPGFPRTRYTKYPVFIPYNELHVAQGDYNLLFKVSIFWKDANKQFNHVATSEFYKLPFKWRIAESGEISKLDIDYNAKREGKNGLDVSINYSAHGMKGKKGRFVVEFYYELSQLAYLYAHGRESEGIMSYAQEFEPQYENTDYKGGHYRVPYDMFPLKVGKNVFYFKVWLQALSADDKWYTLDATCAKEFYVNNGELKLKEVWVIEEKRVVLDWDPTEAEMKLIRETLVEFNRRLYDASDGQIRVKSFVFGKMARHPDNHYENVFRIYKDFKSGDHGDVSDGSKTFVEQVRPFAYLGTPDRPGDAHLAYEKIVQQGPSLYSRALVHEFHHATFGLGDEYGEMKDSQGRAYFGTFCANDEVLRHAWNCCIMGTYQPLHRELCKPDTHTKDKSNAKLHEVDCYTRVKLALKKSFNVDLVVPDTPVEGPDNPPEPKFSLK